MEKIAPESLSIEKIKVTHDLSSFQSSEKELQSFLVEDALHNQEQNISVTFLWLYKEQIVSYMTLLVDRITLKTDLQEFFKQKQIYYPTLPALRIGRLCVDDRFQRRGLGTYMLRAVYQKTKNLNEHTAGCRFLTVDAKNKAISFYQNFGFQISKKAMETTNMFFDIKTNQQS